MVNGDVKNMLITILFLVFGFPTLSLNLAQLSINLWEVLPRYSAAHSYILLEYEICQRERFVIHSSTYSSHEEATITFLDS